MARKVVKFLLLCLMSLMAMLIAAYAFHYLDFKTKGVLQDKPAVFTSSFLWNTAFYLHVLFGGIALFAGAFQFFEGFRNRYLSVHRKLGITYVVGVTIGGLAGLSLSLFATGGIISRAGFFTLAVLWLFSIYKAFTYVKQGKIDEHRMWMIRSYALTLAAVTLRIWLPLLMGAGGLEFMDAYRTVAWLCWVPNILIAELIVLRVRREIFALT